MPFLVLLGIEVLELGEGTATAILPAATDLTNHMANHHAGAIFTVGETAAAAIVALLVIRDAGARRGVLRAAEIDYLAPSKGALYARATSQVSLGELEDTLQSTGAAEWPVEVQMTDADGTPLALMMLWARCTSRNRLAR